MVRTAVVRGPVRRAAAGYSPACITQHVRHRGFRVPGSILGNRVVRKEDPKFLTTGGMYLDDLNDVAELGGAAHVAYVRSSRRPRHDHVDRHRRRRRRCPACSASSPPPTSACSRSPSPFNPAVARTLLASDRVRYVGEPIAAVVAETRAAGRRRRRRRDRRLRRRSTSTSTRRRRSPATTLLYDAAGSNVVFDSTALGMPDLTGDEFFADCEVTVVRHVRQPARRPVPAGGARLGGGVDRRPAAPVGVDAARPGHQGRRSSPATASTPTQVRVITPDVGGGFGAKIGTYPEEIVLGPIAKRARAPGALAGDAQRVDDGARPRPGAGPARHDRRPPRRHGHALPPARHPGLRRVLRHGRDPRPVHDPADVVGRLRHPQHRVPHDVGGHQHHADRRPTAAPAGRRRRRRSSGRWTCSPPRSASTRPRSAGRT